VYRKGQQLFEAALTPFVKQCMQEAFPTLAGSSPEDDAHLAAVRARVEREATRVQELATVRDVALPGAQAAHDAAVAAVAAAEAAGGTVSAAGNLEGCSDSQAKIRLADSKEVVRKWKEKLSAILAAVAKDDKVGDCLVLVLNPALYQQLPGIGKHHTFNHGTWYCR
jgi:D-alanyl-D-alanine carboxypeptidase